MRNPEQQRYNMDIIHLFHVLKEDFYLLNYLNIDYFQINWSHLLSMLIMPACILIASLTVGIILNNLINRRTFADIRERHCTAEKDNATYLELKEIHKKRGKA